MRVLQLFQPTDGGVARHVADIANTLPSSADFELVLSGPSLPDAVEATVEFRPLALTRSIQPLADCIAVSRLRKLVSEARPDVIHAHSSKAGAIARLAKLTGMRTPVVYTPHGYAFAGYFESPCKRGFYRAVERGLAPLADLTVCVCRHEMRLARSLRAGKRARLCYNGVNVPGTQIKQHRDRASGQPPTVVCLSLLRPGKGVEDLLAAVALLRRDYPDLLLHIAGQGSGLDELRRSAEALGVADAVQFLGHIEDPDRLLTSASVFVLPSWAESLPYALLEAMALGMPIVATKVGGIAEAISDQHSGLLVPPRNPTALSEAIGRLLGDPHLASALGAAAHQRAYERFNLQEMLDCLAAIYREAAGHGAQS